MATCGVVTQALCAEQAEAQPKQKSAKVASLEELIPYLISDNNHVTIAPGTYRITAKDIKSGKFDKCNKVDSEIKYQYAPIRVTGNNNTYDFTGVTVEVETAAFNAINAEKYSSFGEIHILGNYNTIKGLTLVDVGKRTDVPRRGCTNVSIDGIRNLMEGVEVRSMGSTPYGYGEIYGKGREKVIKHYKHCSTLVRGEYNTVKDCRIIHYAYGHFIVMQAAKEPSIIGCYVEGEMGTTDAILREKGTGTAADKINFKTVWGYPTPKGYTLALGEDGIRTYNRGTTYINGKEVKCGTNNVTVKDCVVKHARGGVAVTLSSGFKRVENCTLIGCQGGFNVGSGGEVINCRADAAFGPVLNVAYDKDKNMKIDITIMPYEGEKYSGNGSKQAAFIQGTGHDIIFRKGEGLKADKNLEIYVGGDRQTIGNLAADENALASGNKIVNETDFVVVVDDNASGNTITSASKVIDNGANNTVSK